MMVALGYDGIRRRILAFQRSRRLATAREEGERKKAAEYEEQTTLAVENLGHLHAWEFSALFWIYHRGGRARASVNDSGIGGPLTMKLLAPESARAVDWTDTIFVIPPKVKDMLEKKIGPMDRNKIGKQPPWERQR